MTLKELRAAAQHAQRVAGHQCTTVDEVCDYILATVRDDDDEPVTQEFCDLHSDVFVPTMGGAYRVRRFRHVVIYNGELHIGNDSTGPVTVGRLRVILSALGIELKEPA